MQIEIEKVSNGYIAQIPGKMVTEEMSALIPQMGMMRQNVHLFVFHDIMDLLVFVHKIMDPPAEAKPVSVHGEAPKTDEYPNMQEMFRALDKALLPNKK